MASESEGDTSRVTVRTYVPAYQREEWDDHADNLDMSRSEYVRSMVQAGRRGFENYATTEEDDGEGKTEPDPEGSSPQSGAPSEDMESVVVETLSEADHLSWEQLLAAVTDDIEGRLEEALQRLQDKNRVRYSGRNGGYTLDE